jgi:hypothetical protein
MAFSGFSLECFVNDHGQSRRKFGFLVIRQLMDLSFAERDRLGPGAAYPQRA